MINRPAHKLRPVGHGQFGEDIGNVFFNRPFAQHQLFGNLAIVGKGGRGADCAPASWWMG
jgi:hypothetical protein